MGQKVSPHGLRVGVIKDWDSKWYADKRSFSDYLIEDHKIREFVKKKLYAAGIAKVIIERAANNQIRLTLFTGKPGQVIGRAGTGIDDLKAEIKKMTGKEVAIDVLEVRRMELDAQLSAESIAQALERRISFRRAMKSAIQRTMKAGAKGIKVLVSGRLGGAEIARSEKYSEGNVPLHTLRADIGYGFAEANTTYGKIGVKVWINHGEILAKGLMPHVVDQGGKEEKKGRGDRSRGERDGRSRGERGDRPRGERGDRPRGDRPRGDREGRPSRDGGAPEAKAVSPRRPRAPRAEAPKAAEAPAAAAEAPAAEARQEAGNNEA